METAENLCLGFGCRGKRNFAKVSGRLKTFRRPFLSPHKNSIKSPYRSNHKPKISWSTNSLPLQACPIRKTFAQLSPTTCASIALITAGRKKNWRANADLTAPTSPPSSANAGTSPFPTSKKSHPHSKSPLTNSFFRRKRCSAK